MPFRAWQKEHRPWLAALESALDHCGALGAGTARYLREHRIRVGVRAQTAGARWTADRRIEINPRYVDGPAASPYVLSLVVHEVRHLQQGPLTALSVYGELDAWRVQFEFLRGLSEPAPGSDHHADLIRALLALPLGWDRHVLSSARQLMRAYAGKHYRIDLLPLYPLHREFAFLLGGRVPEQI